jgi:homoserine O-succinyltransferase
MNESRAAHQDIRPLKIIIVNLMPIKRTTRPTYRSAVDNPLLVELSS